MIELISRIIPIKFDTYYGDEKGRLHFTTWWQWAGRCFAVQDCIVDHAASGGIWLDRYSKIEQIRTANAQ